MNQHQVGDHCVDHGQKRDVGSMERHPPRSAQLSFASHSTGPMLVQPMDFARTQVDDMRAATEASRRGREQVRAYWNPQRPCEVELFGEAQHEADDLPRRRRDIIMDPEGAALGRVLAHDVEACESGSSRPDRLQAASSGNMRARGQRLSEVPTSSRHEKWVK
jgi:hypothetical protein